MKLRIKACSFALIAFASLISIDRTEGAPVGILHNFAGPDGEYPLCPLLQTGDGSFYGTTYEGGAYGYGTVFRFGPDKKFTTLASFDYSTMGGYPYAGLILGQDGNFYGTTLEGGTNGYGTVFKMTPKGKVTVLASFDYTTMGGYLYAGVIQGKDGNFYGVTYEGGPANYGTVFRVKPNGNVAILASFDYSTRGGYLFSPLIQCTDSNFYGTTSQGGASGYGTAFKMTPQGAVTILATFDYYTTGGDLYSPLTQGPAGNLYGLTYEGGPLGYGTLFSIKMVPSAVTVLAQFDYSTTGGYPYGSSIVTDAGGNLYGTTYKGGAGSYGTVFKLTSKRNLSALASFDYYTTGGYLTGGVIMGLDGALYGTAEEGGAAVYGTLFRVQP